jgi:DNA-binding winged helix-turn-helix (wHTH) protein/pimeloyl-ACP methyl ester carboxylesterase
MGEPRRDIFRFAEFELDAFQGELHRSGVPVKLQLQPLKVLALLVSRAGQLVTRADICRYVWGQDTFVDYEHGLNYCVRQVRMALGDDKDEPRFIETLPRRGYRFRATVTGGSTPAHARAEDSEPTPAKPQRLRFCTASDGVRIAYTESGSGPPLVRVGNWLSDLRLESESPLWRSWIAEFSRHHRLFRYDARGTGLSDHVVGDISFDAALRDLEALIEAADLERVTLMGIHQGGAICVAFAARRPDRVARLVLYNGYARGWRHRGIVEEVNRREAILALIRQGWGREHASFRNLMTSMYLPDGTAEQQEWFNAMQKAAAPEVVADLVTAWGAIDVTPVLPRVRAETVVVQSEDHNAGHFDEGRLLAGSIEGAEFVPLPTRNHLVWLGDVAWERFSTEIGRFLGWTSTPSKH